MDSIICYGKMFRNTTLKMVNFEPFFRNPIGHGETRFLKDFDAQTYMFCQCKNEG